MRGRSVKNLEADSSRDKIPYLCSLSPDAKKEVDEVGDVFEEDISCYKGDRDRVLVARAIREANVDGDHISIPGIAKAVYDRIDEQSMLIVKAHIVGIRRDLASFITRSPESSHLVLTTVTETRRRLGLEGGEQRHLSFYYFGSAKREEERIRKPEECSLPPVIREIGVEDSRFVFQSLQKLIKAHEGPRLPSAIYNAFLYAVEKDGAVDIDLVNAFFRGKTTATVVRDFFVKLKGKKDLDEADLVFLMNEVGTVWQIIPREALKKSQAHSKIPGGVIDFFMWLKGLNGEVPRGVLDRDRFKECPRIGENVFDFERFANVCNVHLRDALPANVQRFAPHREVLRVLGIAGYLGVKVPTEVVLGAVKEKCRGVSDSVIHSAFATVANSFSKGQKGQSVVIKSDRIDGDDYFYLETKNEGDGLSSEFYEIRKLSKHGDRLDVGTGKARILLSTHPFYRDFSKKFNLHGDYVLIVLRDSKDDNSPVVLGKIRGVKRSMLQEI